MPDADPVQLLRLDMWLHLDPYVGAERVNLTRNDVADSRTDHPADALDSDDDTGSEASFAGFLVEPGLMSIKPTKNTTCRA
jgi:hypothetical protein